MDSIIGKIMKITPNFTASELCVDQLKPDDYAFRIMHLVADNLQAIRDFYGKPVRVHSGYRDPAYNKQIGGSATSQHQFGEAVDFSIPDVDLRTIYVDITSGKIRLPHLISQLILEESTVNPKKWGWIHLAVWTKRFESHRKEAGKDSSPNQYLVYLDKRYRDSNEVIA